MSTGTPDERAALLDQLAERGAARWPMSTQGTTPRPSVHDPLTKSYAIDQITDVEQLRSVAHRMWEAFLSAHAQAAHAIAVLKGYEECAQCTEALNGGECFQGCERWQAWQAKVTDGFGSV